MTEKDYMRIEDFKFNEIDYVKVDLEIINKEKLPKLWKFMIKIIKHLFQAIFIYLFL